MYTAFGESTKAVNGPGYRGLMNDAGTGLTYMRHRFYNPMIRQFMSEDPAQAGLNWYQYAGNDPVNAWDPSGLDKIDIRGDINSGNAYAVWTLDDGGREVILGGMYTAMSPSASNDLYLDTYANVTFALAQQVAQASHIKNEGTDSQLVSRIGKELEKGIRTSTTNQAARAHIPSIEERVQQIKNRSGGITGEEALLLNGYLTAQESWIGKYVKYDQNWQNNRAAEMQVRLGVVGQELATQLGGFMLGEVGGVLVRGGGTIASEMTEIENAVRYGPMNKGPLPETLAQTFRSSSYSKIVLQEDTILYRVYGGASKAIGGMWSRTKPSGPLQARMDLALKYEWGNTIENVIAIKAPKGTIVYEGFAGEQGKLLGGGSQVFIPDVNSEWVVQP